LRQQSKLMIIKIFSSAFKLVLALMRYMNWSFSYLLIYLLLCCFLSATMQIVFEPISSLICARAIGFDRRLELRNWTGVDTGGQISMRAVSECNENRSLSFYAQKQLLLSARLSHRNSVRLSVRPSVTRMDQSKTVRDRITKSLPSAAWKTLVSGTVKLFHKFEEGHLERGR